MSDKIVVCVLGAYFIQKMVDEIYTVYGWDGQVSAL